MPARAYACPQSDHGVTLRCWSDTQRCRVRVPGTRRRGTYGDKAKPSVAPHFRRLCCESANGTPLPAAMVLVPAFYAFPAAAKLRSKRTAVQIGLAPSSICDVIWPRGPLTISILSSTEYDPLTARPSNPIVICVQSVGFCMAPALCAHAEFNRGRARRTSGQGAADRGEYRHAAGAS